MNSNIIYRRQLVEKLFGQTGRTAATKTLMLVWWDRSGNGNVPTSLLMTDDSDTAADQAATVLLLAPEVGSTAGVLSAAALDGGRQPDRAVAVTVTGTAESWLDGWERRGGPSTAITCVDVDGATRSAASESDRTTPGAEIERVTDPAALEELGRTVSDVLQRADDEGESVALFVHTLDDLLAHVDEATAFKFVYTLGEVVRRVDGVAYFHLDPDAHDPETVETFSVVCDRVVELDRFEASRSPK